MKTPLSKVLILLFFAFSAAIGAVVQAFIPMKGNDLASLAGAVIGSGLTIAGAIATIEWQASRERQRGRQMVIDQLEHIEKYTLDVVNMKQIHGRRINSLLSKAQSDFFQEEIENLRLVLSLVRPDSIKLVAAYARLRKYDVSKLSLDAIMSRHEALLAWEDSPRGERDMKPIDYVESFGKMIAQILTDVRKA